MLINIHYLLVTFGYAGVFAIVFAESGFLLGFFLPGDSLLFTAGVLASQHYFSISALVPLAIVAAIAGDSFGYWCGRQFGPRIFQRDDSLLFSRKQVQKTQEFYDRHGRKAIILARFVPIVRTFVPIMAGVAGMPYKSFFSFNVVGGFLWAGGLLLASYFLGSAFPQTEAYLSYIIAAIIALSVVPVAFEFIRARRA